MLDALSQRLYDDLRHLAAAQLKAERPDHTLQPTALVHEAYLRLSRQHAHIADRHQFTALVSGMMRRILVDHARSRQADKRGGHHTQVTLTENRVFRCSGRTRTGCGSARARFGHGAPCADCAGTGAHR